METLGSIDKDELSDLSKFILTYWQIWNDRNNKNFISIDPLPMRTIILLLVLVTISSKPSVAVALVKTLRL